MAEMDGLPQPATTPSTQIRGKLFSSHKKSHRMQNRGRLSALPDGAKFSKTSRWRSSIQSGQRLLMIRPKMAPPKRKVNENDDA